MSHLSDHASTGENNIHSLSSVESQDGSGSISLMFHLLSNMSRVLLSLQTAAVCFTAMDLSELTH